MSSMCGPILICGKGTSSRRASESLGGERGRGRPTAPHKPPFAKPIYLSSDTLCRVTCLLPDIVLASTTRKAQLPSIGTDCVAARHREHISEKQLPNVAEPRNREIVSQGKEKQRDGDWQQGCEPARKSVARFASPQGLRAAPATSQTHRAGIQAVSLPCSQTCRICLFHRVGRRLSGEHNGERAGRRGRNNRKRGCGGSTSRVARQYGADQRLCPSAGCWLENKGGAVQQGVGTKRVDANGDASLYARLLQPGGSVRRLQSVSFLGAAMLPLASNDARPHAIG